MDVLKLLNQVRSGEVEVAEAAGLLKKLPYEELGFAKLDHHRELRRGCGEVVFCPGKARSIWSRSSAASTSRVRG